MTPSLTNAGKPNDVSQEAWKAAQDLCDQACLPERLYVCGVVTALQTDIARSIMAAKAEGLPKLDNTGTYLAKDNTGQWHYINHAGTWQGCPPPFPSVEDEREACAEEANGIDPDILEPMSDGAVSVYCRARVDAAASIRKRGGE